MTRINVIPAIELTGKHLVAEYRELPRVFSLVRRAIDRDGANALANVEARQPARYTLGKGHVLFFYDKLLWLSWRHLKLVNEMSHRGYKPQFSQNLRVTHQDIPTEWWNDWEPDDDALAINRARIEERLSGL